MLRVESRLSPGQQGAPQPRKDAGFVHAGELTCHCDACYSGEVAVCGEMQPQPSRSFHEHSCFSIRSDMIGYCGQRCLPTFLPVPVFIYQVFFQDYLFVGCFGVFFFSFWRQDLTLLGVLMI